MMSATALLLLVLAAPEGEVKAPEDSIVEMENRAEALVVGALQTVKSRISVLEELKRRREAGESVSLSALRTSRRLGGLNGEALSRELARIEELEDEIRVAQAARRARASETPRETDAPTERPATTSDEPPAPERTPSIVPAVVGEPEIRLADARYRAEDFAGALGIFEKAAADGENTWARLRRARCLERLGRDEDARNAYESLIEDHPDDRWARAARWSLRILTLTRGENAGEEDAR